MKAIRWTIWILGALLIMATLDSQPDPPAVNPSTALSTVLPQHECDCDAAVQYYDSLDTVSSFPVSLIAADASEPHHPSDRMIQTVQAADPSPPASHAGRKLFFPS
jgi:hypothetical protein